LLCHGNSSQQATAFTAQAASGGGSNLVHGTIVFECKIEFLEGEFKNQPEATAAALHMGKSKNLRDTTVSG